MTRPERGSASLLVLAMTGLVLFVAVALVVAAAMVRAHRVAQSAADLAALAGAASSIGEECARAGEVAALNGASLTSCVVEMRRVTVSVTVTGPRLLGQPHDFTATARAGPS